MKRFTKLAIIVFVSIGIAAFTWQMYTPMPIGASGFPLTEKWRRKLNGTILDISVGDSNAVFIKTTSSLIALNQRSGDLIWETKVGSQVSSRPAIEAGERVFVTDEGQLWAFDAASGEVLWSQPLEDTSSWVTDASNDIVLVNLISNNISAYDAKTGAKLWSTEVGRGYIQAYIENKSVYIVDHGITAYNALHGNQIWHRDQGATGQSVFANGVIYFLEYSGQEVEVIAFDTNKKREMWRIGYKDEGRQKLYFYNKSLVMTDSSAIYRIDQKSGATKWKLKLSDPENVSYLDEKLYTLEQFTRIIHVIDIDNGSSSNAMILSFPRLIDSENQIMVTTDQYLIFSRGKEVFTYGHPSKKVQ